MTTRFQRRETELWKRPDSMTKFLKRWLLNSAMGTAVILAFGVIMAPVVYFASLGADWCIAISILWIIIALAGLIAWIEKQ